MIMKRKKPCDIQQFHQYQQQEQPPQTIKHENRPLHMTL